MTQKHLTAERARREIIRLSQAGLDFRALQSETLKQVRKVIPIEAAFFATVDPATLLFTSAMADDILQKVTPHFIENEFLQEDVNKFTALARGEQSVGSLVETTQDHLAQSQRYREILSPLGLGDELRAALVTRNVCWGVLCLHRERSSPSFSLSEATFLRRVAPSLAEGLRNSLLLGAATATESSDAPGLLLLTEDLSLAAITPMAERLLSDVAEEHSSLHGLPYAVHAAASRLRSLERSSEETPDRLSELAPRVRVRTVAGHWLVLHASWLTSPQGDRQIAVIVEVARPVEIAQLIVQTYALSHRESEIVQLVAQGKSTTQMAEGFHITANTVQDHLKAIFEKVGVRSRRELVGRLFAQQYQPRIAAGRSPGADGWFA